jgi:hypothetical protein
LKKSKKQAAVSNNGAETQSSSAGYPKVSVEEVYEPTNHLNAVIGQVKDA